MTFLVADTLSCIPVEEAKKWSLPIYPRSLFSGIKAIEMTPKWIQKPSLNC
jgi:hypothetical protein